MSTLPVHPCWRVSCLAGEISSLPTFIHLPTNTKITHVPGGTRGQHRTTGIPASLHW